MKKLLFVLTLLLSCSLLWAQQGEELHGQHRQQVILAITGATRQATSLQCSFVQTKRTRMLDKPTVATGTMTYEAPTKLSWSYSTPVAYSLNIDGDKVNMSGQGATNANLSHQAKALSRLILGCVNGAQLFDERFFTSKLFDNGEHYYIALTPKKKDLRRVFSHIIFCFNRDSLTAESIELTEKSGDSTIIQFEKVKVKR